MHFLRSERLGTLWLGVAVFACLAVEAWRSRSQAAPSPLPVSELLCVLEELPAMDAGDPQVSAAEGVNGAKRPQRFSSIPVPEVIAVAKLDSAKWVNLGLSPLQARGAVRYARALGGMKDRMDLERMKVLPEGWLGHFGSALRFPTERPNRDHPDRGQRKAHLQTGPEVSGLVSAEGSEPERVEINSADSLTLVAVKGIGPWVAGHILDARRRWGGIADLHLLSDALGGWDSLALAISPLLRCDTAHVHRRCPGALTVDQWRDLPTVGMKEARVLERAARHHKGQLQEVLNHPVLDSMQKVVLSHYLKHCPED